jgi:hypothetical protein
VVEKFTVGESLDFVEKSDTDAACISVVSPSTVIQARHLGIKLRTRFPQPKIAIGFWGTAQDTQGVTDVAKRLRDSGANEVVTALNDAAVQLTRNAPALREPMIPAAISGDVEEDASAPDLEHNVAKPRTIHPRRRSATQSMVASRLAKQARRNLLMSICQRIQLVTPDIMGKSQIKRGRVKSVAIGNDEKWTS